MKQLKLIMCILFVFSLMGCHSEEPPAMIAATTLPVYEFTLRICEGTEITVTRLITENVSCLHDYSLKTNQMRAIEGADVIIINGSGLEEFLNDALLPAQSVIDCSANIKLLEEDTNTHDHNDHGHIHKADPHIWLSPKNAKLMAESICTGLIQKYPEYETKFKTNLSALISDLDELQNYGSTKLAQLYNRELITFHDGFFYFAECFDLSIIRSVEEESGAEASAFELIELINEVNSHKLPAIFIEINGSVSAANIIAAETGVEIYALDMAMSGNSYFESMYYNIDTIWEALQ